MLNAAVEFRDRLGSAKDTGRTASKRGDYRFPGAPFKQNHDVNTRVNCIQGSCDRQSLLGASIKFHANQQDVGFMGSDREDVACRGYRGYFEARVSRERFREELAGHTAAVRDQDANGSRQLRTFWM
jgi:hypothetical protein